MNRRSIGLNHIDEHFVLIDSVNTNWQVEYFKLIGLDWKFTDEFTIETVNRNQSFTLIVGHNFKLTIEIMHFDFEGCIGRFNVGVRIGFGAERKMEQQRNTNKMSRHFKKISHLESLF